MPARISPASFLYPTYAALDLFSERIHKSYAPRDGVFLLRIQPSVTSSHTNAFTDSLCGKLSGEHNVVLPCSMSSAEYLVPGGVSHVLHSIVDH